MVAYHRFSAEARRVGRLIKKRENLDDTDKEHTWNRQQDFAPVVDMIKHLSMNEKPISKNQLVLSTLSSEELTECGHMVQEGHSEVRGAAILCAHVLLTSIGTRRQCSCRDGPEAASDFL